MGNKKDIYTYIYRYVEVSTCRDTCTFCAAPSRYITARCLLTVVVVLCRVLSLLSVEPLALYGPWYPDGFFGMCFALIVVEKPPSSAAAKNDADPRGDFVGAPWPDEVRGGFNYSNVSM